MTDAPATVADAMRQTALALAEMHMPDPRREARLLLAVALDAEPLQLVTEPQRPISATDRAALSAALARRLAGEPLSRIAGTRGFWTLDLAISPAVLDPRPETELLVEQALAHVRHRHNEPLRVLDLGTGSGCILLALLAELPNALGIGVDRSQEALAMARTNGESSGFASRTLWVSGNWADAITGSFDIIASNPPYIPAGALATLDRSVRAHDPAAALDGGPDGLAAYRLLIPTIPRLLTSDGIACLEVGRGQAPQVAELAAKIGCTTQILVDFAGIQRCVTVMR